MTNTHDIHENSSQNKRDLLAKLLQEKVGKPQIFPISFAQQRLWFIDQLQPGNFANHIWTALRLTGLLRKSALLQTLNTIVRRHEVLRTTFATLEDKPVQIIIPDISLSLPTINLEELTEVNQEAEIKKLVIQEIQRPFNLSQAPLLRATLLRLKETEHILVFTMHHIISDGWSMGVLIEEVTALYEAFSKGQPSPLAELPIQYVDFASFQRQQLQGEVLKSQLSYWKQQLEGAPELLELPTDKPRPAIGSFQGSTYSFELSDELHIALNKLSQQHGTTLFMTLLAAFKILLCRYTGSEDIVVGSPIANRDRTELEGLIGLFANTIALRTNLAGNPTFEELLTRVRKVALGAYAHQDLPFEQLVEELQPQRNLSYTPVFQVMFVLQNTPMPILELPGLTVSPLAIDNGSAKFDLTLEITETPGKLFTNLEFNTDLFEATTIKRMAGHFQTLLKKIVAKPKLRLLELSLLTEPEQHQLLREWNDTKVEYSQQQCIHELFEAQVQKTPDAIAVVFENQQLTYCELNNRANQLAHYLQKLGVKPEVLVGICVERSLDMIVGLLAILKAGGAYLPLDPTYPQERLTFMLADAQVPVLLTQQQLLEKLPNSGASVVCLNRDWQIIQSASDQNTQTAFSPDNLAYTIYTSGSTGKPKGVMVSHRNVVNFFTGMDGSIGNDHPGTWLAVTSISFDISVLELLWTLTRGFQVVINGDSRPTTFATEVDQKITDKEMAFSLFYFASDEVQAGTDKYHLLLEGAKFADKHAFAAIWTPERHFHEFGGLYPNPSVVSAAIATITERIQIRAGSIVLPLQNPIRVAEEWSVVDNLSRGRVGISFASGWHANDFVLAPEKYSDRFQIMFRDIETVRQLWRGESITLPGGSGKEVEVKIHPQPIQPEVPIWVTAAGSPETFRRAGEIGANLLTHLLDQNLEELEEKIAIYRQSWQEHGHGLGAGHVTLMIHTFVGEDIDVVREKVRQPFYQYLKSSLSLLNNLGKSLGHDINAENFTAQEQEQLLNYAFNRYFETSSLLGTPSTCLRMINRLKAIGVDEVACLIDFGVDVESVLSSLHHLNTVRELSNKKIEKDDTDYSLPTQIARHNVTHLQCTPSLARILIQDNKALSAMGSLRKLMLGGEALPISLAEQLRTQLSAEIYNMYGPTETTIWSTSYPLQEVGNTIPIGRPIANTEIYILDRHLQPVPVGIPGELYIGGEGVVRGYLNQPELTVERFISNPFGTNPNNKLYKTGDLAHYLPNGNIEFLGRVDHQVKLQGYRIELGEIETVLSKHPGVVEAVVVSREEQRGDKRLVAYVVPTQQAEGTQVTPTEKTHLLADEIIANKPTLSIGDLRAFIKERLPEYMVPSSFVTLNALPLTPNGKIDRSALPAPEASRPELEVSYVAPKTEVEKVIASIWQELLQVERVGIHDNFFELGGNSLLLIQLPSKLQKVFQRDFTLVQMFQYPTISHLVKYFSQESSEETSVLRPAHHSESRTASVQRRKQVRKERRAATQ
ncbi:LLM class flavin-dependent oxidoreductase [Nostoc cf. edaphicum LEGE 07299]|uniref:LLM class flavin-dependent oxidoreductase n=1 Tax=Nostoc cf. edaphicum LEGE 07299 TaxID=2777974 RepID=A0ABR9TSY8_9NOSO|nr:MupA/Atu3671 family FMN-dependent luciferase-like monooxygenase [Nostoc edaphicum]MBE9103496.1 LLM class flavin-dependent oxidoreductase [Nostoc cf. edaphicum LEGE 07299]